MSERLSTHHYLKMPWEIDQIHSHIIKGVDEAWAEWLKQRGEDFNLHIYHGDSGGTCVQFNSFGSEFVFCVSLGDVIKSAINCNDGKKDLLTIARDLRKAADRLTKAAEEAK
jgi:hypothetical protein